MPTKSTNRESTSINLRVPHELLHRIKLMAAKRKVPYQSLIKDAMVTYMQLLDDEPAPEHEMSVGRASWVYFAQELTGYRRIKIGWSRDVQARLKDLQQQYGTLVLLLVMPGDATVERSYHVMFAAYRAEGEWFMPHTALLSYIENQQTVSRESRPQDRALLANHMPEYQPARPVMPTTTNHISEDELAKLLG